MQYLGGKKRLAPKLAAVLRKYRKPGQRFVDVFAGSLAITAEMENPRVANDACRPLMLLYTMWDRLGWRPGPVDETVYAEYKRTKPEDDPMTAFIGFGCSYGGKWYGGYARDRVHGRDFAATASRSIDRTLAKCEGIELCSLDFGEVRIQPGDLVYCDPPYRGTTGFGYFTGFDYPRFLQSVAEWHAIGADVFLSEYTAPPGFVEVASWDVRKSRLKGPQTEKLFRYVGNDTSAMG